jgi:hypothetical protein
MVGGMALAAVVGMMGYAPSCRRSRVSHMESKLAGKHILIVKGSLLADAELRDALVRQGARVSITGNLVSAFDLVGRKDFDGAVVDHGLHNEAFDLCTEFQALSIPYISASTPHRLQGLAARERDADVTVERLANILDVEVEDIFGDDFSDYIPPGELPSELRAF